MYKIYDFDFRQTSEFAPQVIQWWWWCVTISYLRGCVTFFGFFVCVYSWFQQDSISTMNNLHIGPLKCSRSKKHTHAPRNPQVVWIFRCVYDTISFKFIQIFANSNDKSISAFCFGLHIQFNFSRKIYFTPRVWKLVFLSCIIMLLSLFFYLLASKSNPNERRKKRSLVDHWTEIEIQTSRI